MKPCIIIPARMDSSRFYGKPLALLAGLPVIVHVMNNAQLSGIDTYVATPSRPIFETVLNHGGKPLLVESCRTGTERVYKASKILNEDYDMYINIQGDCPLIVPRFIKRFVREFEKADADMFTVITPMDKSEYDNPNCVKAYCYDNEYIHDFSRVLKYKEVVPWHHVGIYGFKNNALSDFQTLPTSINEYKEKLEQLRAIDNGMKIGYIKTTHSFPSVDTREDLVSLNNLL